MEDKGKGDDAEIEKATTGSRGLNWYQLPFPSPTISTFAGILFNLACAQC